MHFSPALLMLTLLLGSAQVLAAPATPVTPQAQAESHYEQGVEAYRAKRYRTAIEHFLAADNVVPSPALSYNVARAYERLDEAPRALEYYRTYLRRGADPKNEAEVRARVREISALLARRGVQQITVRSEPSGARLVIDGRTRGTTPWTGELELGRHRIVVDQGSVQRQHDVVLVAEQAHDLDVSLTPDAGQMPAPEAEPASTSTGPVASTNDATVVPTFLPWAVAGAGVVALGGAGVYELMRRDAEDDAKAEEYQPAYYDHRDRMLTYQTTARVLAGVGGVLVLTGGVLAVINRSSSETTSELPPVAFACDSVSCTGTWSGKF
ncbi:MAG TPA: PEGA domain-containing protein [Polyangiaceae bacterium]|nr:PEGA domain-containing protein [Polyangiaceae bacterium]